jgi:hypothetical protein
MYRIKRHTFINWEEVEQAHAAVNKGNQELKTPSKLLPAPGGVKASHRRKRGLINPGMEALKFLFGMQPLNNCRNCIL